MVQKSNFPRSHRLHSSLRQALHLSPAMISYHRLHPLASRPSPRILGQLLLRASVPTVAGSILMEDVGSEVRVGMYAGGLSTAWTNPKKRIGDPSLRMSQKHLGSAGAPTLMLHGGVMLVLLEKAMKGGCAIRVGIARTPFSTALAPVFLSYDAFHRMLLFVGLVPRSILSPRLYHCQKYTSPPNPNHSLTS